MTGSASSRVLGNYGRLLSIRLLTGAWCLTCFVLITAYSSVVISHLTRGENYQPIINSANDLQNKPDIKVSVYKGFYGDQLFKVLKYNQFNEEN